MPLIKKYSDKQGNCILIWEMEEPLLEYTDATDAFIKSERRKLELRSTRHMLGRFFKNETIIYDQQGKPYFESDNLFVSISHSKKLLAVATATGEIGMDIEFVSSKAYNIRHKFLHKNEYSYVTSSEIKEAEFASMLIWSVKEAVFKKFSHIEHLIFSEHLEVYEIDYENGSVKCKIYFTSGNEKDQELVFERLDNFVLAFTL